MEKFLKDYVKSYIQVSGDELTKEQLQNIVNNLMNNDELWDTFDSFIYDELDNL